MPIYDFASANCDDIDIGHGCQLYKRPNLYYCGSIIIRGIPYLVDFVGTGKINCSMNDRFYIGLYSDFSKIIKLNIQIYLSFPEFMKIGPHDNKWTHSMLHHIKIQSRYMVKCIWYIFFSI